MKIGDLELFDASELDAHARRHQGEIREVPRESVDEQFRAQARRTPDAIALLAGERRLTYGALDREVDRVASLLAAHDVGPGALVAVLLHRSPWSVVSLLAILRAGATYCPLHPDLPYARLRHQLRDSAARFLISESREAARLETLAWDCPAVNGFFCIDCEDYDRAIEPATERMSEELWDHVGRTAADAIGAGGWKSAATGAPLSAEIMREFAENAWRKLAPRLDARSRVLEIGCGSGLTLRRLAASVASYCAVDLSHDVLSVARRDAAALGLDHVHFAHLAAHDIDRLPHADFDIVILNSVIQSFPGPNYLRRVLRALLSKVKPHAAIFLGNVWDLDRKDAYADWVRAERERAGLPAASAQFDAIEGLFLTMGFVQELRADLPGIARVDVTPLDMETPNELAAFSFDAVLTVDRDPPRTSSVTPRKARLDRRALPPADADPVPSRMTSDAVAYVIYTSGSTGLPKGVQIEMRSLVNLCAWYARFCGIDAASNVLQIVPASFDASIKNFLTPLLHGGRVTLFEDGPLDPGALLRTIRDLEVTTINPGVPSAFYPVVELAAEDDYQSLQSVRCLALGGEPTDLARLRAWLSSPASRCTLANIYGPTECADISTCRALTAAEIASLDDVPIGKPIANARAYVLDSRGRPEPDGVAGELVIAGAGVGRGYLARPDLTQAKFLDDPFVPGERMYRTGDVVRRLPDGDLLYVGRADDQVKVRGYRIELGEIEVRLKKIPGVLDAAALAVPDEGGALELCAWIVTQSAVSVDVVGRELRRHLPEYMIPAHVIAVDALPRSLHGKLDRRALPRPASASVVRADSIVEPRTSLERAIADEWRAALGLERVGVRDNFFDLGGHSLKAAMLVARYRTRLRLDLSLTEFYRAQTIEAQAAIVNDKADPRLTRAPQCDLLQPLADGNDDPLICFPPIVGLAWTFAAAARDLRTGPIYACDFVERADLVQDLADAIQQVIRASTLDAPRACRLLGYSAGGSLAFEVARVLERRGVRVRSLVLVDSRRRDASFQPYGPATLEEIASHCLARARAEHWAGTQEAAGLKARVKAYCRWYSDGRDRGCVEAPMTLLLAAGSQVDAPAWRSATMAGLHVVQGAGAHDHMLSAPDVDANVALLRRILTSPAAAPAPESHRHV